MERDQEIKMVDETYPEVREERRRLKGRGGRRFLALAGFGSFLHLPLFGYDCHVEQAKRQNHHHKNECHGLNLVSHVRADKITDVPFR